MSENKLPSSPPLFSHRKRRHGKGYQRCVAFVGIDKNDENFGQGFPLCVVIRFKRKIFRYAPRTYEVAKLLASLRILYGDKYMEELMAMVEAEYLKMRRDKKWLTLFGDGSE